MTTSTPDLDAAIGHFKAAEEALSDITSSADSLRTSQKELDDTRTSISEAAQQLDRNSAAWSEVATELENVATRIGEAADLLKQAEPEALREEVRLYGASLDETKAHMSTLGDAVEGLKDEVATTTTALSGGLASATDQLAGLRTRMSDELESVNTQIARNKDAISAERAVAAERHDAVASELDSISVDVQKLGKRVTTGVLTVGLLAGSSLAGTVFLIVRALN